jgi:hypothetical protein
MTINLSDLDHDINLYDYICITNLLDYICITNLLLCIINQLMLYVVMYSCTQILQILLKKIIKSYKFLGFVRKRYETQNRRHAIGSRPPSSCRRHCWSPCLCGLCAMDTWWISDLVGGRAPPPFLRALFFVFRVKFRRVGVQVVVAASRAIRFPRSTRFPSSVPWDLHPCCSPLHSTAPDPVGQTTGWTSTSPRSPPAPARPGTVPSQIS